MPPYIISFPSRRPKPMRHRPRWLNALLFTVLLLLAALYSWLQNQLEHPHTLIETALQAASTMGFLFCVALIGRLTDSLWR